MTYAYARQAVYQANSAAKTKNEAEAYSHLRTLPLADFCEAICMPLKDYPELTLLLPSMPPEDIQKRWTGHCGRDLLIKSCNIMRLFQAMSYSIRGIGIDGNVLDYGCGWGRLTRLMTYFIEQNKIYAIDPMDDSLDACKRHKVQANLGKIDALYPKIPFQNLNFNFIFSYSVMTHTSLEATEAILSATRSVIDTRGLFITTIRPVEFWEIRRSSFGDNSIDLLMNSHLKDGYSFVPVGGGGGLSREHYGDSSFSFDFFANTAARNGWKVVQFERDMLEPYQVMVGLIPD